MTQVLIRLRRSLAGVFGWSPATKEGSARSSFEAALGVAGLEFSAWLAGSADRLYVGISAGGLERLKQELPAQVEGTLRAADAVIAHRFDLLGSGPFVPLDPGRPARVSGYRPIDWYLDPVRDLRFPHGIPHTEWNLQTMRPGTADIKYPWELSRCQHWPVLAQAWQLSHDTRYAREIADQLDDFTEANPVGLGVNWTCTMDVALRALNWAIALQMIRSCADLPKAFWLRAYGHLYDHGVFIFANLENKYEVTSNHFLSNVVGLHYAAAVFSGLDEGLDWDTFCRDSLEREIEVQVLEDGADYESSVPYHRLVTELFLGSARLAQYSGKPLSDDYRAKLARMVAFLAGVLRPDGLMPQIGDADDGRLHILSGYGSWNPQDARHIFGPASLVLDEPNWLRYCGPDGAWEAAWWGFDAAVRARVEDAPLPDHAQLYPQAGVAITRAGGTYLAITNGIVGTKGFGNHKHNDQLSFEFHLDGQPLIVDPGSFVYTSDPDARNLFRGTGYHNTVMVGGAEQNELRPEWLFRLFETAKAEHQAFEHADGVVEYRGRHVGYERLATPIVHERTFKLQLADARLLVMDRLMGDGEHECVWHFHLAPGVQAIPDAPGVFRLEGEAIRCLLELPRDLEATISDAWYSPAYGVRVPCFAIEARGVIRVTGEATFETRIRGVEKRA